MSKNRDLIERYADENIAKPLTWSEPNAYDASTEQGLERLCTFQAAHPSVPFRRLSPSTLEELWEVVPEGRKCNASTKQSFVDEIKEKGVTYGTWFHMNDGRTEELVQYLPQELHELLLNNRDTMLTLPSEQLLKRQTRVFYAGLSVGRSTCEAMLRGGGFGTVGLADFDTVGITGMNRTSASYDEIGARKIDSVRKKISQHNPYITQHIFPDGYSIDVEPQILAMGPNIMFDAMDRFKEKAQIRRLAQKMGSDIIMVTDMGPNVVASVERYSIDDKKAVPFGGRIKSSQFELLANGALSPKQEAKLLTKIATLKGITPRLLASVARAKQGELAGVPQKGTTSAMAGAIGAIIAEEIVVGRPFPSGDYVIKPSDALKMRLPDSYKLSAQYVMEFLKYTIKQR